MEVKLQRIKRVRMNSYKNYELKFLIGISEERKRMIRGGSPMISIARNQSRVYQSPKHMRSSSFMFGDSKIFKTDLEYEKVKNLPSHLLV